MVCASLFSFALVCLGLACTSAHAATLPQSVNVVLLGSTGNLAQKYLWQGLYNIHAGGLNEGVRLSVYPAASKSAEKARPLHEAVLAGNISAPSAELKDGFLARVAPYTQLRSSAQYAELGAQIAKAQSERGELEVGRLVYLSVPPKFYGAIATEINANLRPAEGAWLRVIVEKPFGVDTESARQLASEIEAALGAHEVLLVDHYMGKPGVKAAREFRLANPQYEPLLRKHDSEDSVASGVGGVASVEVAMVETEDCAGRTGFYDEVGVLRDTMQNHLMMMVALLTMEIKSGENEPTERTRLFKAVHTATPASVITLGQYNDYNAHVDADRARWNEAALSEPSRTPTYANVVLRIGNKRWDGVPFYLTSGKSLAARRAYTAITFDSGDQLVLSVQGKLGEVSGAMVRATAGLPPFVPPKGWTSEGGSDRLAKAPKSPSAYEVLLRAALEGETESFVRLEEVLESWRVWTPLLESLDAAVPLVQYANGGIGLPAALSEKHGVKEEL